MGHSVMAASLLEKAASAGGFDRNLLDEIFRGVPLDFPVIFGRHLPLAADRFGMAGITLFRRVYLLEKARSYAPEDLITLIRHEAEHVRQQRSDRLFYLRYAGQWLGSIFRDIFLSLRQTRSPRFTTLAHTAYLSIQAEREAYNADSVTRRLLRASKEKS